ncbi:MAG: hypothetical protein H0T84_01625 [Tatlockia sp.]|nr:hypothetical protein [Tatlockia sp.]
MLFIVRPPEHIQTFDISIEDNFAVLAGLQILKNSLQNTAQTAEVIQALERINIMLNGGITLNGYRTNGLLSFLFNGAFDVQNRIFYTRGTSRRTTETNDWRPYPSDIKSYTAINTNLWAISALGVETIDNWFGSGTALQLWQTLRERAGYFNNNHTITGEFWGLGTSFNNNLGVKPDALMTTAETAAAINALNSLIDFYGDSSQTVNLSEDLNALEQNILHLRNDLYLEANFMYGTTKDFFITLPTNLGQAYLYASRRFPIPFDWNANTLVSTLANCWVLMNNFNFNPFQYRGKLSGENYAIPESLPILNSDKELADGSLTKIVVAPFKAGDFDGFRRLAVRYNFDGSQTNWITSEITTQREGFVTLPRGTKAISISFIGESFVNVCQIIPATDLCIDEDCVAIRTINARWSLNGLGNCDLSPD